MLPSIINDKKRLEALGGWPVLHVASLTHGCAGSSGVRRYYVNDVITMSEVKDVVGSRDSLDPEMPLERGGRVARDDKWLDFSDKVEIGLRLIQLV